MGVDPTEAVLQFLNTSMPWSPYLYIGIFVGHLLFLCHNLPTLQGQRLATRDRLGCNRTLLGKRKIHQGKLIFAG